MVVVIVVTLNFTLIKDLLTCLAYRPSPEMTEIRDDLYLTNRGYIIFNATFPELMEKQVFNEYCRDTETENAVLGCYRDGKIYVYNITDEELTGIRELTSTHELLHAVYDRLTGGEKSQLKPLLEQVYEENRNILGEEIDLYKDDQKLEELYVRIGTEIADLPKELEDHYATFFKKQDKITEYYQSYISVFKKIEENLKDLLQKAKDKEAKITAKTAEYESGVNTLNQDIGKFNNCAKTPDCFTSNWAFNNSRQDLLARQKSLQNLYNEINTMISDYNTLVAEYNENVLHGQSLNMSINSNSKIENF